MISSLSLRAAILAGAFLAGQAFLAQAHSSSRLCAAPTPAEAAGKTVYYLKESISLTTPDGILSVHAGAKGTLVKKVKEGLRLKFESGSEAVVKPSQVTTDSTEATQSAQDDAARLAATRDALAQQQKAAADQEAAKAAQAKQATNAYLQQIGNAAAAAAAAPGPSALTGSALDAPPEQSATVAPRATPRPTTRKR